MLSRTAEYGLRAALYLAEHWGEGPIPASIISGALSLPRNYLSKTLHLLASHGVLTSARGRHGGYELARPPDRLCLMEVLEPFDGVTLRHDCLLDRPDCTARRCPVRHEWRQVAATVDAFLHGTTLKHLVRSPR